MVSATDGTEVAVMAFQGFLVADTVNNVVRRVQGGGGSCELGLTTQGLKLLVTVAAPGTVTVTPAATGGRNAVAAKKSKRKPRLRVSSASGGPGTITVVLKLRGKAKKAFKRTGKAKVTAAISFAPAAPFPAFANNKTATLRLKKAKKRKR